jgi:hypothetical protein
MQRLDVAIMGGIGHRSLHLDQQRLEPDPQLQRRLTISSGVEIRPGARNQPPATSSPLPKPIRAATARSGLIS